MSVCISVVGFFCSFSHLPKGVVCYLTGREKNQIKNNPSATQLRLKKMQCPRGYVTEEMLVICSEMNMNSYFFEPFATFYCHVKSIGRDHFLAMAMRACDWPAG